MAISKHYPLAAKLYMLWLLVTLSSGSFLCISHPEMVNQLELIAISLITAACLVGIGYFVRQEAVWAEALFILYTVWSTYETVSHLEFRLTVSAPATVLSLGISTILLKGLLTRRSSAAPKAGIAEGGA